MPRGSRLIRLPATVGLVVLLVGAASPAAPPPKPPHPPGRAHKGSFHLKIHHKDEGNWALTLAGFLALGGVALGADAAGRRLRRGRPDWRAVLSGVAAGAALGGGVGIGFHWAFSVD